MICPSCKKKVKDGTSICPHCDAVLDESILAMSAGGDGDGEGGEDTPPPKPAPKKASAAKRPAARKPAPIAAKTEDDEPAAKAPPLVVAPTTGKYKSKYDQYWTEDAPAKPKEGPSHEEGVVAELHSQLEKEKEGGEPDLVDPLVSLKNLWTAFLASHFEDKMTIASGAMLIVCGFMPWRSTLDGDDMGMFTAGIYTFLLAIVGILSIWARKTGKLPKVPRGKFPLVAMGAGGLSALVSVIFIFTSFSKGVRAGRTVTLSEPSFGVFLALISAAGLVVGGLLTLKREKT